MMHFDSLANDAPRREGANLPVGEQGMARTHELRTGVMRGIGAGIANEGTASGNYSRVVRWIAEIPVTLKRLWDSLCRLIARVFTGQLSAAFPLADMPVDAFIMDRVNSLNRLSPDAILNLDISELLAVPSGAVKLLSLDLLWGLSEATQNELGFGRLNSLSHDVLSSLQPDELNKLQPISIRGLSWDVLNSLSDATLNGLSADVINGLSLETLIQITPNILNKLSPIALSQLEPRVFNSLPLDPLPMLRNEVKKHLTVKPVRWSRGLSLDDVITPAIQANIRNGNRPYWVRK
ncbi:hypothetical protein [Pseudochelatococcus sp. G4_1912]|uniref:hypothetical protein n=1 Tax=Pseudochelatococcus sp. G4_1912 TaxID=3114288 RepID=UPI0039C6D38E